MADPTEYAAMNEYNNHLKRSNPPRNISPEVMGQQKAMIFNAALTGGLCVNAELAGWDSYSKDKKTILISSIEDINDLRYLLNRENNNDILAIIIGKKRELEVIAQAAGVAVK